MTFWQKVMWPITAPLDFITKYFKALVFLVIVVLIFGSTEDSVTSEPPNLAKVYLYGPILDAGPFLDQLKEIGDESIKGVMVIVDSPGGAITSSLEIAEAIKELGLKKKVVTYAAGTLASGSYYASIWSDLIIANPGSIVGSIGVVLEGANIEELMDKIGISSQSVHVGKFKKAGTIAREWTQDEREELQRLVSEQYNLFVGDVAEARNLKPEDHTEYADAHIFSAKRALEAGLIDHTGTLRYAEKKLALLADVKKPVWKEDDSFEKYLQALIGESMVKALHATFSPHMR